MFSGAEQLVDSFFVELSAELRLRPDLKGIGEDLSDYGESFAGLGWLPVVGPWIERGRYTAKILGKYLSRRREGVRGRREKLDAALRDLEQPLVVILDDIDRLSSSEIRDIFKLVRLTASFPNVIYVVAFDRIRVEQALEDEGVPGRDYLEKILQVGIDLPVVPQEVLLRQITEALNQALSASDTGTLDPDVWPSLLLEVIRPLIRNMRDVRRYAASVHATIDAFGKEIALADLLGMEAIRIFLPDVYAQIQVSVDGLCTPSANYLGASSMESAKGKDSIERLLKVGGDHEPVVRALLKNLFPFSLRHIENNNYGSEWLKGFLRSRRVAHAAVLRFYLERMPGKELMDIDHAEYAWQIMDDGAALDEYLRSLPLDRQEDVIAALENFEEDYQPAHVLAATPVLLNLVGDLAERPKGLFDLGSKVVVTRVVYRLLRSLGESEMVEEALKTVLPDLRSLSAELSLLTIVGYRVNAGHKLISEEAAKRFERDWRERVRSATPEKLAQESDLFSVLFWAQTDAATAEEQGIAVPDDPKITLAVLKSARSENLSQSGTGPIRRTPVFHWPLLEEIYGGEAALIARIEALKHANLTVEKDLEELMDKYLSGWRPKSLDDEGDNE